jgi:hypothetical protein
MLYNPDYLDEREIRRQADRWAAQQLIAPEQLEAIRAAMPKRFREVNVWLEIGAFLFTILAGMSLYGLIAMQLDIVNSDSPAVFGWLSVAYAVGLVFFTKQIVQKNQLCRNGTDNALLVMMAGIGSWGLLTLISAANGGVFPPFWVCALVALPVLLGLIWWSGDVILSYSALVLFYGLLFDRLLDFSWGKLALPFVLMGVSGGLYALVHHEPRRTYYAEALGTVRWLALAMVVLAGNYYVVRELNAALLDPVPPTSPEIALPGLFWAFTVGVPLLYLAVGIRTRSRMFLILGGLGIAAAVATVRHYYGTLPLSVVLAIDGAIVSGLAVALIRYLRPDMPERPRHGFTDVPDEEPPHALLQHIGTLTTMQAQANAQQQPHLRFGGSSDYDGGGAGDRY